MKRLVLICLFCGNVGWLLAQSPVEELSVPGHNLFVNQINSAQRHFPNIKGKGITLSIKEYRFDSSDVDFKGRYLSSGLASEDLSIHASIVGVLAAGAGTTEPGGLGVAPEAQISSSSFGGLKPDSPEAYSSLGISVQNHAYGNDIDYRYSQLARAFDQSALDNPALLHVFSAGNKGSEISTGGIYQNIPYFATLTGSYKMAKNVLSVGAVDSFAQLQAFSSRGPDYCGRLKPDLVAFGQDGTSGAAALVTGAATLVQQAYKQRFDRLPQSAMTRAILLGAAADVGNPGPDYSTGFGNLNLKKSLDLALYGQLWEATVSSNESLQFPLEIPENTAALKLTLCWNDPPADTGVNRSLVHNLDISLLDPQGQRWQPYFLSAFPHPDSLALPARRGRDTLNNVEQIVLAAPMPGHYEIRVESAAFPDAGTQAFAMSLALEEKNQFEWSCPVKNDPMRPEESAILRWNSRFDDSLYGHLSWKPVDANEWKAIDDSVFLKRAWRRWQPETDYGLAQLRMQVGASVFLSDTFLIAPRLFLKVGYTCADSSYLFWEKARPDANVTLWGLGNERLEALFSTKDSAWIFSKSDFPQQRFAISYNESEVYSLRSAAPDPEQQGAGCFISVFYAGLIPDGSVRAGISLGTLFQVRTVVFEKEIQGQFVAQAAEAATGLTFSWDDPTPNAGLNRYRAKVILQDDREIYSDVVDVYAGGETGVRFFPNPVVDRQFHIVINQPDEHTLFRLFDSAGRLVFESPLVENHTLIQLPFSREALCFWTIRSDAGVWKGKLLFER